MILIYIMVEAVMVKIPTSQGLWQCWKEGLLAGTHFTSLNWARRDERQSAP